MLRDRQEDVGAPAVVREPISEPRKASAMEHSTLGGGEDNVSSPSLEQ